MQTVGFDLDMTLVDSSQSILLTTQRVLKGFGIDVDEAIIAHSIGLPIKDFFQEWVGEQYLQAYESYVANYQSDGFLSSYALPGSKELLSDLIARGIKVVVITAKNQKSAEVQLHHLDIPFTEIIGNAFRRGKTEAMRDTGCVEYVGDHIEDYMAATEAGIHFIGVATNPMQKFELTLGANFPVIKSLEDFWDFSILQ